MPVTHAPSLAVGFPALHGPLSANVDALQASSAHALRLSNPSTRLYSKVLNFGNRISDKFPNRPISSVINSTNDVKHIHEFNNLNHILHEINSLIISEKLLLSLLILNRLRASHSAAERFEAFLEVTTSIDNEP